MNAVRSDSILLQNDALFVGRHVIVFHNKNPQKDYIYIWSTYFRLALKILLYIVHKNFWNVSRAHKMLSVRVRGGGVIHQIGVLSAIAIPVAIVGVTPVVLHATHF
jgi:hypothetical protein